MSFPTTVNRSRRPLRLVVGVCGACLAGLLTVGPAPAQQGPDAGVASPAPAAGLSPGAPNPEERETGEEPQQSPADPPAQTGASPDPVPPADPPAQTGASPDPVPPADPPAQTGASPPPSPEQPAAADVTGDAGAPSTEEAAPGAPGVAPGSLPASPVAADPAAPTGDAVAPAAELEPPADRPPPPRWLTIESRGELGFETRAFWPDDASATDDWNGAMVGRLHVDAAAGRVTGKARLFSRFDPRDRARGAFIPEELWVELRLPRARLRAGYQMINWTATEAFHPADVVNSRYLDSAIENPEKLGEPMASLRIELPHGSVDAMFMPVFIEPIFPTARSRQRFQAPGGSLGEPLVLARDGAVVADRAAFPAYRFVPQGALRLQQTWGSTDVSVHALSHIDRSFPVIVFDRTSGTPRPLFLPVTQAGGTYQQALGGWLLKLELAYRWYRVPAEDQAPFGQPIGQRDHFVGAAGIEYGLPHAAGSESTLLLEGQIFVPRDRNIPETAKPLFQHDVLVGVRHAFNDEASRAVTVVVIVDAHRPQELFANAGYAQRLGETWSLQLGARFVRVPPRDPANPQVFEWLNDSHQLYANLFRHF